MFVSAISACACAHHEPTQETAEASSCHSTAHDPGVIEIAAQSDHSAPQLGGECDCLVRLPVPAIPAKSDGIKLGHTSAGQNAEVPSLFFRQHFIPLLSVPPEIDDVLNSFRSLHLASGPSRAPPRL